MTRILVTNDDGVDSEGIKALAAALSALGDIAVVAPMEETSAIGHALTLRQPLRLDRRAPGVCAVNGTPTDCVNIAIAQVLRGQPDLIVSGINKGLNVGDDVTYSGTVSGALEGALLGVPSLAVSTENRDNTFDFEPAATAALAVAAEVLERGMPRFTLLNINVPFGPNKGYRVTVQARRSHVTTLTERHDPRGRKYYWLGEGVNEWESHDRSDYQAVRDGYISITPLQSDLTAHEELPYVESLSVVTPAEVR
jgi:5'-nucleotidase